LTHAAARRRATAIFCFATIYLVWGSTYLTTKIGVRTLPPFLFGGARFLLGGLLLYAVAVALRLRRGEPAPRPTSRDWRHLLIVGFVGVFASNGGNVWGVQHLASNQAALLNVSATFWIALLGTFGKRAHPLGLRTATGLAIGFIGTALIAWPQEGAAANFALGAGTIAVLFACFNWAVATTYLRNIDTTLDVMTFTGLQMIIGGVMMMTLGFALNEAPAWNWNPLGLAMLAYMTLFSSCLAYTAYGWLSVNMTPAQVSTYAFVNPAVATLLGWWVLDEHLNVAQSLGMAVILGAMLLVNWPAARDTAQ